MPIERITPLSGPEIDQAIALRDSRYSTQQLKESGYQTGDTPDQYLARILELYPQDDQKAYILGLDAVAPIGVFGLEALSSYIQNQNLDQQVEAIFPRDLNSSVVGADIKQGKGWYLRVDPEVANPAIAFANLAEIALRRFGDQRVQEAHKLAEEILSGKALLNSLKLTTKLKVGIARLKMSAAKNMAGREVVSELFRQEIEKSINLRTLGLSVDLSANRFRNISRSLSDLFDPFEMFAEVVSVQLSLDDLMIHPSVGEGIFEIYQEPFRK